MEALAEQIEELEDQIDKADIRADEAWKNWDAEAYEGASSTRNRLYAKLQELRRALCRGKEVYPSSRIRRIGIVLVLAERMAEGG